MPPCPRSESLHLELLIGLKRRISRGGAKCADVGPRQISREAPEGRVVEDVLEVAPVEAHFGYEFVESAWVVITDNYIISPDGVGSLSLVVFRSVCGCGCRRGKGEQR